MTGVAKKIEPLFLLKTERVTASVGLKRKMIFSWKKMGKKESWHLLYKLSSLSVGREKSSFWRGDGLIGYVFHLQKEWGGELLQCQLRFSHVGLRKIYFAKEYKLKIIFLFLFFLLVCRKEGRERREELWGVSSAKGSGVSGHCSPHCFPI